VDDIGEGISVFFAFEDHVLYVLPGVAVVFHGFDDLDDGLYIFDVLLDILSLESVNILLLL
jgi:hypothetical protein